MALQIVCRQSNADRLAFANEIIDDILDSADKPLTVTIRSLHKLMI